MLIYLFKASCCLAILMIFYKLFMENQKMHRIKRAALLFFLLASSIIPAITITYYMDAAPYKLNATEIVWDGYIVLEEGINLIPLLSWSVYWIGFLFFGFKFFRNIITLQSSIRNSEKLEKEEYTLLLQENTSIPHSFFNYLFVNKEQYKKEQIPQSVIDHEVAHARQKHSFDILFIELAQWFFWFNPLIFLLKRDIRLNHEFLADEAVINQGHSLEEYQNTLLRFSQNQQFNPLTHTLHFHPLKKRFLIMKKKSSTPRCIARLAALVPLMALLTFVFSSKALAQTPSTEKDENAASESVVREYNKIAKEYATAKEGIKVISKSDIQRLKTLYDQMSEKQRQNAEPFPDLPAPPPPAPISVETVKSKLPPPPPPPVSIEDMDKSNYRFYLDDEEMDYDDLMEKVRGMSPVRIKNLGAKDGKNELRVYSEEYYRKNKMIEAQ